MFSRMLFVAVLCLIKVASVYSDETKLKLGLVLCQTGECSADGKGALEGAELAADELNKAGGILGKEIKLIAQDTFEAMSGAKAVTAYRQLRLDSEIHFIIGPSWTPAGLALAPIVAKDKQIVIITPSLGVADFHKAGDNIFNMRGVDEVPTRMSARFALEKKWKRAAVFSSQQPWENLQGRIFAEEFRKGGGELVELLEPLPAITGLSAEASKVASAKPDVIFFSNLVQMAIAAKELKKIGWSGNKIAAFVDDTRRKESSGTLIGTFFYTFQMPTEEYSRKFENRFGRKPEVPAAGGYDAVYAIAKAISAAGSFDPLTVKGKLLDISFNGASGPIKFDSEGCVIKPAHLWQVTNSGFDKIAD